MSPKRPVVNVASPLVVTSGFLMAPERQTQWRAFLRRGRLIAPVDASILAEDLRAFLLPVLTAAARDLEYEALWNPGGPWVSGVK
jgi:hypothetical protein